MGSPVQTLPFKGFVQQLRSGIYLSGTMLGVQKGAFGLMLDY